MSKKQDKKQDKKQWTWEEVEEKSYQKWDKGGRKGETETFNINQRRYECRKRGGTWTWGNKRGSECVIKKTNIPTSRRSK